jgi:hypothetical protein
VPEIIQHGGGKRARLVVTELVAKPDDPPGIQAIFGLTSFNMLGWVQELQQNNMPTLKTYYEYVSNEKQFDRIKRGSLDMIDHYKNMKDSYVNQFWHIASSVLAHCFVNFGTLRCQFWHIVSLILAHYVVSFGTLFRQFWHLVQSILAHCFVSFGALFPTVLFEEEVTRFSRRIEAAGEYLQDLISKDLDKHGRAGWVAIVKAMCDIEAA